MYQNKVSVIIVAAGSGTRMKSNIPKQFLMLEGRLVLMRTIDVFASLSDICEIVVVLAEHQLDIWQELCEKYNFNVSHTVVSGGATRTESVKRGLDAMKYKEGVVLIHDGVRPFVSHSTILSAINNAKEYGAAVPVVDVVDSMRMVCENGTNNVLDRSKCKIVQTPQSFDKKIIFKSYQINGNFSFSDDATLVESIGTRIKLFEGQRDNVKITTSEDLDLSQHILKSKLKK